MPMAIGKYLNGMRNVNNLIGNFKKQKRCLWTEGGGGTSLDSGVEQNWQEWSVNLFLTSVIYLKYIHTYISDVKVSLLSPAYPSYPPAKQDIYTEDFSNEFVMLNILVLQCYLHCGCAAVQPWSCTLWLSLHSLGGVRKTFSAWMMVVVGAHPILAVLWH